MIELTLGHIANAVQGEVSAGTDPRTVINGITIDSRTVSAGDLFVAIPGDRVDGNQYAEQALDQGASAVLGQRSDLAAMITVADTQHALGALARYVHGKLPELVTIGLTGSSGKTSTKDLLAAILSTQGVTVAPPGSANNELGMPLTILSCTADTQFLVLEMGARGIGHIDYLCDIATPQIGIELNVGTSHLGEFGSRDAIALAKSELVRSLPVGGTAVLNADDPLVMAMSAVTDASVVTFGEHPDAGVRISELSLDELARPRFTIHHQGLQQSISLRFAGAHMAMNAAAAAAAALAAGVDLAAVAEALEQAEPRSRWRMEIHHTDSDVTVINDAYNANPESMRAALKALVAMSVPGRSWAVLGEMLELGDESVEQHDAIGRLAVRLDVDRLIAVGPGARPIHMGAAHEGSWGDESMWVSDPAQALDVLRAELQPGDAVLVKASRSIGLEQIAEVLLSGGSL
jgi:UDP-N-acetylmuramoyl-tripeptide--D-alanyl-D-alanine ligase